MAKFESFSLDIKDGELLNLTNLEPAKEAVVYSKNVVYIYRSRTSRQIYIGQTTRFLNRHKQHYSGSEAKFEAADFDQVLIIFSRYFNRSALDDVESQLITYFLADIGNARKHTIAFDQNEVINRTGGNSVNDYAERELIATEVILPLWEKILYPGKWVNTPTLDKLRADVLVKYSPIKILTSEQSALINEIVHSPDKNYVINGDAGTGKTVLLTHLVANLLNERPDARIGVAVQPNWKETGEQIFNIYGMNSSKLTVGTSTSLINSGEKYDVIIVDESHKLSRRYGKQNASFNEVYNDPRFSDCDSHLEIIQRLGRQIVLMYDVLQAIRPANITREQFRELTASYEKKFLHTQFRIQTPPGKSYTSDDYINGVKYLLYKDTQLLNSGLTLFDPNFDRDVFRDESPDAYFGYFTDQPLHHLIDWVEEDLNYNPEHVNRVLAGLVEPWRMRDGRDASITHWEEGDIKRRWNSTQNNWVNSKDADAEEQIGSVFAVQGIDLNKVGVIIGDDLKVNAEGKLESDPSRFLNTNGLFTKEEMAEERYRNEFSLFVRNIYYVLLTRGIDGIRLGFWRNDAFRRYMEKTLEIPPKEAADGSNG